MDESILSQIAIFSSLPAEELAEVAKMLHPRRYAAGELLFSEGDLNDRVIYILEGDSEVVRLLGTEAERVLLVEGAGAFLGELSLFLPDLRRSASVRALTDMRTLEAPRQEFVDLLTRQPALTISLISNLLQRQRRSENATISDLSDKNRALEQALKELKAAQAQLLAKERLDAELAVARRIQTGLLPKTLPELPGWRLAAHWQPARQVSGDFYDFFPLAGNHLALVIGDVSGKGMPAALVMATTRSVLRAVAVSAMAAGSAASDDRSGSETGYANDAPPFISPGWLMAQVNDILVADMPPNMFVSCLIAVLDPRTGLLCYANAGHNPPYQSRLAGPLELRATGMLLGLMDGMEYEEKETVLEAGDCVLMYSDGLVEAHNPQGEMYDYPRLRMKLTHPAEGAEPMSGERLFTALLDDLADFTGPDWEQEDDVTLVTLTRLA